MGNPGVCEKCVDSSIVPLAARHTLWPTTIHLAHLVERVETGPQRVLRSDQAKRFTRACFTGRGCSATSRWKLKKPSGVYCQVWSVTCNDDDDDDDDWDEESKDREMRKRDVSVVTDCVNANCRDCQPWNAVRR